MMRKSQKKKVFRIATWILLLLLFYLCFSFAKGQIQRISLEEIEIPRGGIIHVDNNNQEELKNGSPEHPFATFEQALKFIEQNPSFKTILVSPGQYKETLILPDQLKIFGLGEAVKIVNPKKRSGKTIIAGDGTFLSNLEIKNGRYGLYIPPDKSVLLLKVKISGMRQWGILSEKNTHTETGQLRLVDSEVTGSGRQGMYLQKGIFYMNNSKAIKNGEEGVDLHTEMKSIIRNSEISRNGEGGIETELGRIELLVENTKITHNGSSGINLQSFLGDSTVIVRNSTITNNKNFGIRCAIHSAIKKPYFPKALTVEDGNVIEDNGKEPIDEICKLK